MSRIHMFEEFLNEACACGDNSGTAVNGALPDVIEFPSDKMTPAELDRHLYDKYGMRLVYANGIPDPAEAGQPGYASGATSGEGND